MGVPQTLLWSAVEEPAAPQSRNPSGLVHNAQVLYREINDLLDTCLMGRILGRIV